MPKNLTKSITFVIPNKKDATSGDLAPDPELLADAGKIKAGDVVLIDATNTHPHPTVKSIEVYTAPQPGHFVKSKEEDGEGGQKNTVAEIEADGKTINAIVPGHLDGKKWVPDTKVLGEVKRLTSNIDVMFRVTDDNGKTWLRGIEKAAKQTHAAPATKAPQASKPEKPAADAKPDAKVGG